MVRLVLLGLCLFEFSAPFVAQESVQYVDGNRLLENCDEASQSRMYCFGYIAGAMDSQVTLINSLKAATKTQNKTGIYCLPKGGIELGQALRVTVKWLKDHPEKLHLPGDILIGLALRDAFACK